MSADIDKDLVWDRLTRHPNTPKLREASGFNADGTEAYVDVYDNGDCIDYYKLLVPFDIKTAIYTHTMENFY